MKIFKNIIGIVLIIEGIVLGIYLGIWVMLVGGIIQIVNALQSSPISGSNIAWGIVKIIFCELPALITYIFCIVGAAIMGIEPKRRRKYKF